MLTKPSPKLTLFDKLSRLSFPQATKLLGPEGADLIAAGGKHDIDITTQVEFDHDRFRLAVNSATVTLALNPAVRDRLEWRCSACTVPCEHVGAAFSLILEEKLALRLADVPPERPPIESLSEEALVAQALAERPHPPQARQGPPALPLGVIAGTAGAAQFPWGGELEVEAAVLRGGLTVAAAGGGGGGRGSIFHIDRHAIFS